MLNMTGVHRRRCQGEVRAVTVADSLEMHVNGGKGKEAYNLGHVQALTRCTAPFRLTNSVDRFVPIYLRSQG
jgi:hypothetical protein